MAEVSADDISLVNNINGPYLVLGPTNVLDPPPGGNGNGKFDPGETGGLVVSLRNVGNQDASDVTALLRSGDTRFVITDSTANYGSIPVCSTRTNESHPFMAAVDQSVPKETRIPLTLFITGTDYCDTIEFTILIGELTQTDPIPDNAEPPRYWAYDDVDTLYSEHPNFSWVEINTVGTRLSLYDDQTVQIDLPFTWQFYGSSFNQISICGNGWVAPGYTTQTNMGNTVLPDTSMPPLVALNWDDLYPPAGNSVWYYHDAANHRFIVEWDSVHYYSPRDKWESFEIIIYDQTVPTPTGDNLIIVQYLTANHYTSSTIGIQDPTRTIGILCLYNNNYHRAFAPLAPRRAIKYTTTPPTAIGEEKPSFPSHASLRAFPNPTTGAVRFSASIPSDAQITIYDASGRLIRTLEGKGSWLWDGRDLNGNQVAPGVYFCRLGSTTTESKLVLLK
ncbi:MAG: T9SS type A sorting domain-containing protein [candidate division WOR-3 bacterium]